MRLRDMIDGLETYNFIGDLDTNITSIQYDSRKIKEGSTFVCIEGFENDGHNFIDSAIKNGARAIIAQKNIEINENVVFVQVKDTRYALALMASNFYNHPSKELKTIGITGTKGKTTITYMIKSILEEAGEKVGLMGTIQNSIGDKVIASKRTTPESLEIQSMLREMKNENTTSCVMEVSSHALDLHRVSCCDYNVGVFTNLTRDHLDYHKTFENYFDAKIKLFGLSQKSIVNIDTNYGKKALQKCGKDTITVGIDEDAEFKATDINELPTSVEFVLNVDNTNSKIKVNIPGRFTIYNALCAIAATYELGIDIQYIKKGLEKTKVPGRAEVVEINKEYTVMIDYAHSPDSLENILTTIKQFCIGRLICVFGCGGDRDKTKRPIMGEVSGKLSDYTIITSDNPRTEDPFRIINEIEVGIKRTNGKYELIEDRKEAIKKAIEMVQKDDIILLAGKGHETYQVIENSTIDFDEVKIVKQLVQNIN